MPAPPWCRLLVLEKWWLWDFAVWKHANIDFLTLFFAFNKWAFANYYYTLSCAGCSYSRGRDVAQYACGGDVTGRVPHLKSGHPVVMGHLYQSAQALRVVC